MFEHHQRPFGLCLSTFVFDLSYLLLTEIFLGVQQPRILYSKGFLFKSKLLYFVAKSLLIFPITLYRLLVCLRSSSYATLNILILLKLQLHLQQLHLILELELLS